MSLSKFFLTYLIVIRLFKKDLRRRTTVWVSSKLIWNVNILHGQNWEHHFYRHTLFELIMRLTRISQMIQYIVDYHAVYVVDNTIERFHIGKSYFQMRNIIYVIHKGPSQRWLLQKFWGLTFLFVYGKK